MALTPKPSVFRNGADDSLGAVDVYSPASMEESFDQVSSVKANAPAEGLSESGQQQLAQGLQSLKRNLGLEGADLGLEKLLALGLSDDQLGGFIGGFLPTAVAVSSLYNAFSGDGVNEVNGALGFLRDNLSSATYRGLNNDSAPTYISALFGVIDAYRAGRLGGESKLRSAGLKTGDSRLTVLNTVAKLAPGHPLVTSILELTRAVAESEQANASGDDRIAQIDNRPLSAEEKLHAKKELVRSIAKEGKSTPAADLIDDLGAMASPQLRRETVISLLRGYRFFGPASEAAYPSMADALLNDLNRIDGSWLWYERDEETIVDYSVLRYAGADTITVLGTHPSIGQSVKMLPGLDTDPKTVTAVSRHYMPSIYVE